MANIKAIAVHKLSTDSSKNWRHAFHLEDTELPMDLFPFSLRPERGEDSRPNGYYTLTAEAKNGDEIVMTKHLHGAFSAFDAMLDAYRQWLPHKPVQQVYFIGTELRTGAFLKVGTSLHPEARLRQLQTSHGERLHIFATTPGDKNLEEKYHRRWSARRRQGEWFIIGDCILNEIARINAAKKAERANPALTNDEVTSHAC